jgi:hypothetical protein
VREKQQQRVPWLKVARRSAEYAIAAGIAVFCGYAIVLWRW